MNTEIIMDARRQLGSFLKSRRLELGINRTKAAELSGLTRWQIQHIEAGDWSYTIDSLLKLMQALKLSEIRLNTN